MNNHELFHEELINYKEASLPKEPIRIHENGEANWLVVPEIPYTNNHSSESTLDLIKAAKRLGLKSAFIFYDASPLHNKGLEGFASKHEKYMRQLLFADLIVPTSQLATSDLVTFFTYHELATAVTLPNIITIPIGVRSEISSKSPAIPEKENWNEVVNEFSQALNDLSDPLNKVGVIYYCVDSTVQYPANTGIQRVVRQLARSLMEMGAKLIPIRLDPNNNWIKPVSYEDIVYLSKWNGPSQDSWMDWKNPEDAGENAWLLIPEWTLALGQKGMQQLQNYAKSKNLMTAWIYFDAVLITLRDIYGLHYANLQHEHMLGLRYFDLILGISDYSTDELRRYFAGGRSTHPQHKSKSSVMRSSWRIFRKSSCFTNQRKNGQYYSHSLR